MAKYGVPYATLFANERLVCGSAFAQEHGTLAPAVPAHEEPRLTAEDAKKLHDLPGYPPQ